MTGFEEGSVHAAGVDAETGPLTTRARVALAIARALAAGAGHDEVSATHVLLGLVREGENAAVAALERAGVALPALREALEMNMPPLGRPRAHVVALGSTPSEAAVLRRAERERARLQARPLAPEHLLLAVLQDETAPATTLLGTFGVRYDSVLEHISAVVRVHV